MFLSWLTLGQRSIGRTACESVLSSQKVRFAHNPKGCSCIGCATRAFLSRQMTGRLGVTTCSGSLWSYKKSGEGESSNVVTQIISSWPDLYTEDKILDCSPAGEFPNPPQRKTTGDNVFKLQLLGNFKNFNKHNTSGGKMRFCKKTTNRTICNLAVSGVAILIFSTMAAVGSASAATCTNATFKGVYGFFTSGFDSSKPRRTWAKLPPPEPEPSRERSRTA